VKRIILINGISFTILAVIALCFFMCDSKDTMNLMVDGNAAMASGRIDEALRLFSKVLNGDPQNTEACRKVADLFYRKGSFEQAILFWDRVEKLDPLSREPMKKKVRCLLAIGGHKSAVEILEPEVKKRDVDLEILHLLLKAYMLSSREEDAQGIMDRCLEKDPGFEPALLARAHLVFTQGKHEEALKIYRNIRRGDLLPAALVGQANCAVVKGNFEEADALFQKAAEIGGETFQARSILAHHYTSSGKLKKARSEWGRILARHPGSFEAIVPLAELAMLEGAVDEIEKLKDDLVISDPGSMKRKYYLLAMIEYMKGNATAAQSHLNGCASDVGERPLFQWIHLVSAVKSRDLRAVSRSLDWIKQHLGTGNARERIVDLLVVEAGRAHLENEVEFTTDLCNTILSLDGSNTTARVLLARNAMLAGSFHDAVQQADSLLQKQGGDKDLSLSALEVRGRAYLKKKQFQMARNDFKEMVSRHPNSYLGYYWLGVVSMHENRFAEAREMLEKAHAINGKDVKIVGSLHDAYVARNDLGSVRKLAVKLISSDDAFIRSVGHSFLAGAARKTGRLEEAAAQYEAAINAAPERIPYYLVLSNILVKLKKYDRARRFLLQARSRSPDHRYVQFKLAYLDDIQGNRGKAIDGYMDLRTKYPDWALVLVNLSDLLAGGNRSEKRAALSMAMEAGMQAPGWWVAHLCMGNRYLEHGSLEKAKQAFESVLKLAPGSNEAKQKLTQIMKQMTHASSCD